VTRPDAAWLAPRLEQAIGEMAAAVAAAPADAPVATCPGWDVRGLVAHLVGVHRWAGAIILTGEQQSTPEPAVPEDELADWYARSATALLAALRAVEPDQEGWTLVGAQPQRAAFWWRRQLHEVTVHTVDVLLATGRGSEATVEPAVAADGVDEVLTMWPHRLRQRGLRVVLPGPVEVSATDTGDRWLLIPGEGVPAVSRPDGPSGSAGADRVAGPAVELYLRLWARGGDDVEVAGAAAVGWLAGPVVP